MNGWKIAASADDVKMPATKRTATANGRIDLGKIPTALRRRITTAATSRSRATIDKPAAAGAPDPQAEHNNPPSCVHRGVANPIRQNKADIAVNAAVIISRCFSLICMVSTRSTLFYFQERRLLQTMAIYEMTPRTLLV